MYTLPKEIHREILSRLEPEFQQITRLTDRYFAGLIQPRQVNLLKFGATYGILEYCEIGLSRGNSKEQICLIAAKHGHLDILVWARSQGCPWNTITCAEAARGGHLKVLKWAYKNGCPWNVGTCAYAAQNNHLKVLKWARSQGCTWNSYTCSHAAKGGHLKVLKWARSNGCPWNTITCIYAAAHGRLEVLKYAVENGCPWNIDTVEISMLPENIRGYVLQLRG
jgi:hypothetical protein